MCKVIVVTSGKGGVGKTASSASIALGLALKGKKTAVLDFDVGLRNLDLIMGVERRVVYDFINVITDESVSLNQALIKDKRSKNLFILPASQTRDKDALTREGVEKVVSDLKDLGFEYVICDSPAGIEQGALMAMYLADIAVVVANPEISSVRDADRMLGLLDSKTRRAEQDEEPVEACLLITRYNLEKVEEEEMLSVDDVLEILSIPLVGVIPECGSVLSSSNSGVPVIMDEESRAGKAYADSIERLLGEEVPFNYNKQAKVGLFARILGRG